MKKIDLTRLSDKFAESVREYISEHDLTQQQVADKVGMQRSHLNALLNKSPNRPLTAYYLLKFIRVGVIKVEQIYDEDEATDREIDFWKQAREAENNHKLSGKIERIREKGVDFEKFLEIHFPNI